MSATTRFADPHLGQPVLVAGAPLDDARAAIVLVHGRGGSAEDMLGLAEALGDVGDDVALVAPQAAQQTWYPQRFMQPLAENEPWLSSALATLDRVTAHVASVGIPPERTVLVGFSQGACLALEWSARHARRRGGVAALSGGLIGPDGTPRDYAGSLDGTPVFLGCSDRDPHIPERRVRESAEVMQRLGADVDVRIYPGMPHTVNQEEMDVVRAMVLAVR